ncbi:GerAB/ArcD/ProY family transporter [Virgibacillus kimchii]
MKHFEYADEKISEQEIMIAVPSIVIGVGILTLPSQVAEPTIGIDGWVSIVISGMLLVSVTWLIAKLAASFPNQEFMTYASALVTKPVAIILTILFSINGVMVSAYVVRSISDIAQAYLFERTPIEVIGLTFLLVVVYAVSGSRAGLFRLNMLFLPIILFILFTIVSFSVGIFEPENLQPFFQTDFHGFLRGIEESAISFVGFGILFFYISLVRNPEKAPKMAFFGMGLTVMIYIIVFIVTVGVFGNTAASNLFIPVIELAKEIKVPGGFFERFDSIFFVIWIMAIFNTMCMAFDATVFALKSVITVKKIKLILFLSPLVFFTGMFPESYIEVQQFGTFLSYYGLGLTVGTALVLTIIHKIKGVKKNG